MMEILVGRSLQQCWPLFQRVSLVHVVYLAHWLFRAEDASYLESQERERVSSSDCKMHD